MKHPVDTSAWGEFVTKDLFGPSQLGKYHNPKNLQESETGYPYICASNLNNGINTSMPYVTGDDLKPTPTNIISWGKQCPYFTYHDTPCITSQGMYYINVADYSKLQIDFIITVLTALTREYNYTNCLIGKIFDELVLKLPLKPSANPSNYTQDDIDWDYMETVMSRVTEKAKDRLASLPAHEQRSKTPVDTSSWGEFVVGELFDVKLSDGDNKPKELPKGNIPLISTGSTNNGVAGTFESDTIIFPADSFTINMFGQAFYQPKPFQTVSHGHVNILIPNFKNNQNIGLFIVTALNAQCQTYSFAEMLTSKKVQAESIKLPIKPSADPENYTQDDIDWDYMDSFMQAVEEKAHARVASLKEQI